MVIGLLCTVILAHASVAAGEQPIGVLKTVTGTVHIIRGAERQVATVGDRLFLNDVLETSNPGSMGVTFKDNSMVSLGSNTRLTLNEFVFDPEHKRFSFVARLLRGTLLYVSGVIAKLSPESIVLKTPTAAIGIRGTRFLVRVGDDGSLTDAAELPTAQPPERGQHSTHWGG